MKKLYFLPIVFCASFFGGFAQGEIEENATTGNYQLFQKGSFTTSLLPNITYDHRKSTPDNGTETVTNLTNVNLRAVYYFTDNIGVVGGYHLQNSCSFLTSNTSSKNTNSLSLFEIGGQYGRNIGDVPVRLEATLGLGSYNVNDNFKSFTSAYNINVGTYFPLGKSGAYAEPFVGYAGFSNNEKDGDFTNSTGGLVAGIHLVKPIGCGDMSCQAEGNYDKGTTTVQFLNAAGLGLGGNTKKFTPTMQSNDGLFGYGLRLNAYQYVAEDLAVGGGVEVEGLNTNSKDIEYSESTFDFSFTPRIRYHVPTDNFLNDFFAEGGCKVGLSSNKSEGEDFFGNPYSTENKSNILGWELGLGYNYNIGSGFAVTGLWMYGGETLTNSETDAKTNRTGSRTMIGLSYSF